MNTKLSMKNKFSDLTEDEVENLICRAFKRALSENSELELISIKDCAEKLNLKYSTCYYRIKRYEFKTHKYKNDSKLYISMCDFQKLSTKTNCKSIK